METTKADPYAEPDMHDPLREMAQFIVKTDMLSTKKKRFNTTHPSIFFIFKMKNYNDSVIRKCVVVIENDNAFDQFGSYGSLQKRKKRIILDCLKNF